jgi:hypothetical protein
MSATDITWIDKPGYVPGQRIKRGEMAGVYVEVPYMEELQPEVEEFVRERAEWELVRLLGHDPRAEEVWAWPW